MGWAGQLSLSRGGTNASLTASNGGIVYSTATGLAITGPSTFAGQIYYGQGAAAPIWSAACILLAQI